MGWALLLVIAYIPVFYRMNMRIRAAEDRNTALELRVADLERELNKK